MAQLAFYNNHNHTTNVTCVERQLSHVLTVHHDDNKFMAQLEFNNNHNHITNVTCYRHDVQLKHGSIGVQQQSQSHYKCNLLSSWCIVNTWLNWRSTTITILWLLLNANWAMFLLYIMTITSYICGVIVIVVERQLSHALTVHHDDNKLHLWCDCDCCWITITLQM
jgi:hypothetical protein